jgi:hypothetical protein
MNPDPVRTFDGRKFLWDGVLHADAAGAQASRDAYLADGFEVQLIEQEGQALLYTRRVVKQTANAQ